jgi:hypothetical protein
MQKEFGVTMRKQIIPVGIIRSVFMNGNHAYLVPIAELFISQDLAK